MEAKSGLLLCLLSPLGTHYFDRLSFLYNYTSFHHRLFFLRNAAPLVSTPTPSKQNPRIFFFPMQIVASVGANLLLIAENC